MSTRKVAIITAAAVFDAVPAAAYGKYRGTHTSPIKNPLNNDR